MQKFCSDTLNAFSFLGVQGTHPVVVVQPDAWTEDAGFHGESLCKPSSRGVWGRRSRLSVQITVVGLNVVFVSTGWRVHL